jgi:tripartite-type tricarboxylate transporter receptor subunit TctC
MVFSRLVYALLAGMVALPAVAQDQPYPARPVTLVVPFPAGGSTDWLARLLGQKLEQRLKAPFIVENRAGGAQLIAASAVAKAAPDGYTLLMTTSTTMAINVSVFKSLPYDPAKDFAPVALVTGVPFVLVVNPSLPVQSVADLVALAKRKPGGLDYVSTGPGSAANLYAVLLKNALAIPMTPIPYKGNAQGLNDVVAGHVSVMLSDLLTALPLVRAGKLRALGVTTAMRVGAAPELAPLAEVGVPGYDASSWHMVATQGSVPKPIIDKLHATLTAIMSDPDVVQALIRDGTIPQVSPPPDELKQFVKSEIVRWGEVVRKAGIAGTE